MALQEAIAGLQDIAGSVTGVRVAPDYAPENLNIWPAAIAFPESGTITSESDAWYIGLHNLILELHVARGDLPKVLEKIIPLGEDVYEALLADPTLGGTVSTYGDLTYEFGPMEYGSPPGAAATFGWRFTLTDVKIMGTLA
jgi:hypothetical protein